MKQIQPLVLLVAAATVMVTTLGSPALASGGGGGNSGGGGGGNNNGTTTKSLTFDDWNDFYNAMLPQGQITCQYNASGSTRSMQVQVSSINVVDGTVMYLETQEVVPSATGNAVTLTYYPITIQKGKGTLSLSTANGDIVAFLTPSVGETYFYVWSHSLQIPLMGAVLGKIG